ncbi:MAG: ABC transporter ATP-binding protein [Chloroflexi bacterium]|uniref:ABC transporter ATP-binding protein n=1 Tax=Candidatus Flexifilum breve TaxID=3140694 RepID=UPI0031368EB2|nr:ABC transporter ATP-binding protein [Chloroflexota bacterium]
MEVKIDHLSKSFGEVAAVNDLNLHIRDGEFVAFLGPSGCGKTTTLLMLAGIYKPSGGVIRFGERVVNQVPPRERNIGMVFQSYALYPHMTVFANIAYPLKLKKVARRDQEARVRRIAEVMGIGELLDRRPGQLSGGQQQRVALGRALVKEPDILLFDEPLSNLDARLRLTMRGEIKHLQKRLGITSVFVTHDQTEAMTMADRIAVMSRGKLQAFDTPEDLYDRPKTLFIAGFIGNPPMNIFDVSHRQRRTVYGAERPAQADHPRGARAAAARTRKVKLGIRAEDIELADGAAEDGDVQGEVYIVEPLGRDDMLDVVIGETHLYVLAAPEKRIRPGDQVSLRFDTANVQFFDPQTEQSLLWQ